MPCVCLLMYRIFIIIAIVSGRQYLYRSSVHKYVETLASHAQAWCGQPLCKDWLCKSRRRTTWSCSRARSCRGLIGGPRPGECLGQDQDADTIGVQIYSASAKIKMLSRPVPWPCPHRFIVPRQPDPEPLYLAEMCAGGGAVAVDCPSVPDASDVCPRSSGLCCHGPRT